MKLSASLILTLLLVSLLGCNSLSKNQTTPLVSPLAGSQTLPVGESLDDEILCIETAKAVAEKGHIDEAIKLYERAEDISQEGERHDVELARLLSQRGDYAESISRFQRHCSTTSATPEVYNDYAWACIGAERYQLGAQVVAEGQGHHPENERLAATMACLQFHLGNPDQALASFSELYGDAAAYQNLAVLSLERSDANSAKQYLVKAMSCEGCSGEVYQMHEAIRKHTD